MFLQAGLMLLAGIILGGWAMTRDGALAQSGGLVAVPTGSIVSYTGLTSAIPAGFIRADGASVPRDTYPTLFARICPANPAGATAAGTANCPFGTADGSSFTLPDMRGRTAVGRGSNAAVTSVGTNEGTATEANRKGLVMSGHGHGRGTISVNSSGWHSHTSDAVTELTVGGGAWGWGGGGNFGWTSWTTNSNNHAHGSGDFAGQAGIAGNTTGDGDMKLNYLVMEALIKT